MWRLLGKASQAFFRDECPTLAAALAFYAIFSLPALLVLLVSLTSLLADEQSVRERLLFFLAEIMGSRVAKQMVDLLEPAFQSMPGGWASVAGIAMLLVGATGVLTEVQIALNRAWQVKPDPSGKWLRAMLTKRLLSLAVLLGVALLLLASLMVSWVLAAVSVAAESRIPGYVSPTVLRWIDQLASLVMLTLLFAAMFRFLPDAQIEWSDVGAGALLTSLLFVAGKVGLSLYLAWSDPTTVFGAAGSLALVLLWIYYSAMIFLFGAEFTRVYAEARGHRAAPVDGAVATPPHEM